MEIEKVKCSTPDFAEENVAKLLKLFPDCEGEKGTVDFDKLRQVLSSKVIEGPVERYEFTWPGKRAAKAAASAATTKTLRPCREESVNFDTTENLYIEGDNLEVLKLLQTSYAGKIKMIYIDPPYNTGHDFVYRDRFSLTQKELEDKSGSLDEDGNRYEVNDSSEARYHSNWCSMMYPRLKLARQLLRDDGVMFVSIDENEVTNLRRLCDEVFGAANFIAHLGWQKVYSPKNQARYYSNDYEFILCYAKTISSFILGELPRTEAMNARYKNPDNDPRGDWKPGDCVGNGVRTNGYYDVISPISGKVFNVPQGKHWVYAPENMKTMIADNRIWFGKDGNSFPATKQFLSEVSGRKASSLLMYEDYGHTDMAVKDVKKLFEEFEKVPFDTPKPVKLLKMLAIPNLKDGDLIVDFFSGSGTLAQSMMELNADDGGRRKYILVQLPEKTSEESEAYQKGYPNICSLAKERIRRAGKKIAEEHATTAPNLDIGFRVLKLDSSSLNDTSATANETTQSFDNFDRIKRDRTSEDLLFQMLLETHLSLSDKIEKAEVAGNEVFFVGIDCSYEETAPQNKEPPHNITSPCEKYIGAPLLACLDAKAKMTSDFFMEIAKLKPGVAFFRDDAFADDSARTNLQQAFNQFSPSTMLEVI